MSRWCHLLRSLRRLLLVSQWTLLATRWRQEKAPRSELLALAPWPVGADPQWPRLVALAAVAVFLGALSTPGAPPPAMNRSQRPAETDAMPTRTPLSGVAKPTAAVRPSGHRPGPPSSRPSSRPQLATPPPPHGLPPTGAVYRTTGSPAVALTFDDGPDPTWTPRVLRLLRRFRVLATFCLIGVNVAAHPELVAQIARDGHTLCNHTTRHDLRLRTRAAAAIQSDLATTTALIRQASGGITPRYFRAPGGHWSPSIVAAARAQGMAALGWSVDPQDWRKPPALTTVRVVRRSCRPGAIVLLHDAGGDRRQTYSAITALLPYLRSHFRLIPL